MPRSYRQLTLEERRTIFRLLGAKVPIDRIAEELGRHRSTIHREIRRNLFREAKEYRGYIPSRPMIAPGGAGSGGAEADPGCPAAAARDPDAGALVVARTDRRPA